MLVFCIYCVSFKVQRCFNSSGKIIHKMFYNLFFPSWTWCCVHELLFTKRGSYGEDEPNKKKIDRIQSKNQIFSTKIFEIN